MMSGPSHRPLMPVRGMRQGTPALLEMGGCAIILHICELKNVNMLKMV